MVTANVPSAKKLIVHGPDLSCIPSQFPIQEVGLMSFWWNCIVSHLYADDTQICGFCAPSAASELQNRVSACVAEVSLWIRSNGLQLNPAKTEILWFTSSRRQIHIPQAPFCVATATIAPSSVVRDLSIYLDSNLSMTTHISKTVSNCFAAMRLIRSVRRF